MIQEEIRDLIREALRITLEESDGLGEPQDASPGASLKVNTRRIKEFAIRKLPDGSTLKELLLSEKDEVDVEEFLAKVDLWLKLLTMGFS